MGGGRWSRTSLDVLLEAHSAVTRAAIHQGLPLPPMARVSSRRLNRSSPASPESSPAARYGTQSASISWNTSTVTLYVVSRLQKCLGARAASSRCALYCWWRLDLPPGVAQVQTSRASDQSSRGRVRTCRPGPGILTASSEEPGYLPSDEWPMLLLSRATVTLASPPSFSLDLGPSGLLPETHKCDTRAHPGAPHELASGRKLPSNE